MSLRPALKVALDVAKDLNTKAVVVGGLATLFWGSKRQTTDVDLQISLPLSKSSSLTSVATRHNLKFKELIMVGMRFTYSGVDIDFLIANNKLEKETIKTAISCNILGIKVLCANINELIALKWDAGREKDIKAINNILLTNSDKVDRDRINQLVPDKPFWLEPDGTPSQLKKASLDEMRSLISREPKISKRILLIADLIEKELLV